MEEETIIEAHDSSEDDVVLTADDVARIRAEMAALLAKPEVQRYRAWVREGLARGSLWEPRR